MRTPEKAAAAIASALIWPLMDRVQDRYRRASRSDVMRRFASAGIGSRVINPTSSRFHYEQIHLGRNVVIGSGAYFSGMVDVGDDVMFGPMVHITDDYHRFDVVGKTIQDSGPGDKVRVVIEADVWVGARVSIMRGVRIGEGSVIGTGSIVTRDIPPYCIAVGSPCHPIDQRFTDDELRLHLGLRGASEKRIEEVIGLRTHSLAKVSDS